MGEDQYSSQGFVLDFVEFCRGTEIPEQFSVWAGVAGVSCALARNTWLSLGSLTIYPNLFICFVAASGERKSEAINKLWPLLGSMEPRPNLIGQKITAEALIDAMRIQETDDAKHLLRQKNQGFIILSELTSLLTHTTYEGLSPLLLNFYDCIDFFEYQTKSGGKQAIQNSCLGFIAATTPHSLTNAIPEGAIGDGLTSRIVMVYEDTRMPPVAIPEYGEEKKRIFTSLQNCLSRISTLQGPVKAHPRALELYVQQYNKFRSNDLLRLANPLMGGYYNRKYIHIWKLALVLCCSEASQLIITPEHYLKAVALVELAERSLPKLMNLISSSTHGLATNMVLELMRNIYKPVVNGSAEVLVSRADIQLRVAHRLSSKELDSVLDTLFRAGCVHYVMGSGGMMYRFLKGT